jgi:cell wall-associated NlpC family hydrolase
MLMQARFGLAAMVAVSFLLCACATRGPGAGSADAGTVSARPVPDASEPPAPAAAGDVVITAMTFLDRPYQAGGQGAETGFDCSGFTRHVFGQALQIDLPRSVQEQAQAPVLRSVPSRDRLQAGDLVFFNTQQRAFSHVGIYLGDGRFIHAPRTGAFIRTESMAASYWARRYNGARRALAIDASP